MNCPNCGAVVKVNDKYCSYCGTQQKLEVSDLLNNRSMKVIELLMVHYTELFANHIRL